MLRPLDPTLHVVDHDFRMPGGVAIGARTSVVRLGSGELWLHAPGPLEPADCDAIEALGPVRYLVAPNRFHHLFLEAAAKRFPEAQLYCAAGVEARYPALRFELLSAHAPGAWAGDLEQVAIEGAPRMGEWVFLHRASRTLLLTDLAFHLVDVPSAWSRFFFRVMGAYGRFGPSRLARSMFRDKAAVRASVDRLLDWDFERVVVTHGQVLERGGKDALREAFVFL